MVRSNLPQPFACISCGLPMGNVCPNLHFMLHPATPATILASCGSLWSATSPACTRCPDESTGTPGTPNAWTAIFPQSAFKQTTNEFMARTTIDKSANVYYAGTWDSVNGAGNIYAAYFGQNWQFVFSAP